MPRVPSPSLYPLIPFSFFVSKSLFSSPFPSRWFAPRSALFLPALSFCATTQTSASVSPPSLFSSIPFFVSFFLFLLDLLIFSSGTNAAPFFFFISTTKVASRSPLHAFAQTAGYQFHCGWIIFPLLTLICRPP